MTSRSRLVLPGHSHPPTRGGPYEEPLGYVSVDVAAGSVVRRSPTASAARFEFDMRDGALQDAVRAVAVGRPYVTVIPVYRPVEVVPTPSGENGVVLAERDDGEPTRWRLTWVPRIAETSPVPQ